jgi:hypothetical protein
MVWRLRNDGDDNEAEIRLKDRIEGNGFMNTVSNIIIAPTIQQ